MSILVVLNRERKLYQMLILSAFNFHMHGVESFLRSQHSRIKYLKVLVGHYTHSETVLYFSIFLIMAMAQVIIKYNNSLELPPQ